MGLTRPYFEDRVMAPSHQRRRLGTLEAVQERVLWLATSIIHHANKVRAPRLG